MKRLQILPLTLLLVFATAGFGLASAETDTTTTPSGLSQYNDSANLSSYHPSIISEESAEQEQPVEDEAVGSELPSDNSVTVEPTEQIMEEKLPETPEHLSGPMNADLRGRLKAETDGAIADPSLPAAEPANPDTSSEATEAAVDADVLSAIEGAANPALPEDIAPSVEAGTQAIEDSSEVTPSEQSTSVPVKSSTVDDSTEAAQSVKTENSPTVTDTPPVPAEREENIAGTTDGTLSETGPAEQFKTHSARKKPAAPITKSEPVEEESSEDEPAANEYATGSPTDQLAEHSGLLPKVSFILKEFGKWLSELIGSVDTLL